MVAPKKLVLLSTNFPDHDSFESNFLNPELPHLRNAFEEVHLLPSKPISKPPQVLQPGVTIHHELAHALGFPRKHKLIAHTLKGLSAQSTFPALSQEDQVSGLSLRKLADLANLGMALRVSEVLDAGIQKGIWPIQDTLFYSYWCKYTALGMAWLRKKHPKLQTVARAHRGDLYLDHAPYHLVTRQAEIVAGIDHIFAISNDGADYLKEHFPAQRQKIHIARLGTTALPKRAQASRDGKLRIISCSYASQVKRLELIAQTAIQLATRGDRAIEWTHFGDGSTLQQVKILCQEGAAPKLTTHFMGNTPLRKILDHYTHNPVDIFMNASRSEGIPVSMMEAMSAGIPCVAPAVGGISELLCQGSGGELVPPTPTTDELADACLRMTKTPEEWNERSEMAYQTWKLNYDSEKNFSEFAKKLSEHFA